jgi:hypothetical protein
VVLDAAAGTFDAAFSRPDIAEVGCNMHSRRYFVKAHEAGDQRAAHVIRAFKALYIVEESVRGKGPRRGAEGAPREVAPRSSTR